jgi:hypothetical protein
MKQLAAAILVAILICPACACCSYPASSQADSTLKGAQEIEQPPKCMEYHSGWRGRGTPRELTMLKEMNSGELEEFLKGYQVEP